METSDKTARLTEREKEVLRAWLDHKTAKEIAIELGISHHAVEKRLKMARVKLDVGSSLEAARMLAEVEGYGRAVGGSPDLEETPQMVHAHRSEPFVIGAIAMILATTLALILAQQSGVTQPPAAPATSSDTMTAKVAQQTRAVFESLDTNGSGFLERPETPLRRMIMLGPDDTVDETGRIVRTGKLDPPGKVDADLLDEFYDAADQNGDGAVSYAEYHAWSLPRLAELGLTLAEAAAPKD